MLQNTVLEMEGGGGGVRGVTSFNEGTSEYFQFNLFLVRFEHQAINRKSTEFVVNFLLFGWQGGVGGGGGG